MTVTQAIFGQPGVYNSSTITLADGQGAALQLDVNGNAKSTLATLIEGEDQTFHAMKVIGNVASGGADQGGPVKIGAKYNASPAGVSDGQRTDIQVTSEGYLKISHYISDKNSNIYQEGDSEASGSAALRVLPMNYAYNGAGWKRIYVADTFKTVSLGAATAETTIWTPTSGKKFRWMGFILTCGAASTLTFKDNTAGTTIWVSRGTTDTPIIVPIALGRGILSAAANNVLTVTRGTSCTLDGVVWGCEE